MQDSSKEWALRLLLADSSAGFRDMKLDLEAWRCLEMPGGLEPELPTPHFPEATACGASAMALQRSSSWEEAAVAPEGFWHS